MLHCPPRSCSATTRACRAFLRPADGVDPGRALTLPKAADRGVSRIRLHLQGSTHDQPRTLYDKIWDDHLVDEQPDGTCLLYIDRHLVHEVTSPQAFEGLRARRPQGARAGKDAAGRRPQRADHRPQQAQSRSGERRADRVSGRERQATSASNITTSSTTARASSTSSGRSRASRCRARRSSAATATPRRMARSARWPTASARPRSSMCSPRRR